MAYVDFDALKTAYPERNFDNVDITEDFNIGAQNGSGVYGTFKFFHGIKSFFKGIAALGTLASGSKILVTDDSGNISYTSPGVIKTGMNLVDTTDLNGALANCSTFNYTKTTSLAPNGTIEITIDNKGIFLFNATLYNTAYRAFYFIMKSSFNMNIAEINKNGLTLEWVSATKVKLTNTTSYTMDCNVNITKIGNCS